MRDNEIMTTRTDYVNKYTSTLQTTLYNFTGTQSTTEIGAGVVKAPTTIHPKNPCQHAADLAILEQQVELQPAFRHPDTGAPKSIDCIRVDGVSDEGPRHLEMQYYWTEGHLLMNKVATLLTIPCSDSSYLNHVELQNSCLSLGHSGTFIPSTLAGSCMDPNTDAVDNSKLQENMSLAIDAYIPRVNGCPWGDSVIHLYRGADSTEQHEICELLVFLKGSNRSKSALCKQELTLYALTSGPLESTTWYLIYPHVFFSQGLLQTGLSSSTMPGWPTPRPSDMVPWWSYPQ